MSKKASTNLCTGPSLRIGVLGGGQLGRMMIQAAIDLDLRIEVMDGSDSAPCRFLTHRFVKGDLNNKESVVEFGRKLDVLTIEIENVSADGLEELESLGVRVIPKPEHIKLIQDKGIQKQFFSENDIPTSEFLLVDENGKLDQLGFPIVQKLRKGGYDGRGVQIIKSSKDVEKRRFTDPSLIELAVDIDKELSVVVARNNSGEISTFPVVEAIFDPKVNLVSSLIAPAQISTEISHKATALAIKVVEDMDYEGLMAVELFLDTKGELLVNEVAPRTHNSGHHTIEANKTSQFAQHLRTVVGMPLGSVNELHKAAGMINLLGAEGAYGEPIYVGLEDAIELEGVHAHLYGKSEVKPHRKMGHVTVTGNDMKEVQKTLLILQNNLCVKGTE